MNLDYPTRQEPLAAAIFEFNPQQLPETKVGSKFVATGPVSKHSSIHTRMASLMLLSATFLSGAALAQSKPEFIVFEHPRAPGKVSEDKLQQSLQLAAQELHVPRELRSCIYVFHVSAADSKAAGVEMTSVWKTLRDGGYRYELWVVGEPTDEVYGSLAVSLLKDSFGLSLEQQEAKRLKDIVAMKLAMTVSAKELKSSK